MDNSYVKFVKQFMKEIAIRNMTQSDVAGMLNTSRSNIQNWVNLKNRMSGDFVFLIAKVFNISLDQLKEDAA